MWLRLLLLRPQGLNWRPFASSQGIVRGTSDNHGHADWMPLAKMQEMFPSVPDEDVGGVVVGEADRVDLGPAADVDFNPDNRATWGNGGRAPLLIDPCKRGSTHSMVIGGGGTYKSTTLVTTLLPALFVLGTSGSIVPSSSVACWVCRRLQHIAGPRTGR